MENTKYISSYVVFMGPEIAMLPAIKITCSAFENVNSGLTDDSSTKRQRILIIIVTSIHVEKL